MTDFTGASPIATAMASATILMHLFQKLIDRGILSRSDAEAILENAASELSRRATILSAKDAAEVIRGRMIPDLKSTQESSR